MRPSGRQSVLEENLPAGLSRSIVLVLCGALVHRSGWSYDGPNPIGEQGDAEENDAIVGEEEAPRSETGGISWQRESLVGGGCGRKEAGGQVRGDSTEDAWHGAGGRRESKQAAE